MPIFRLNMTFLDSRGGQTNKQIEGDFADYTTAETEAAIVITNWQAASGAAIIEWTLGQVNTVASSPTAGSRVTDRLSATLRLDTPGKLVNFRLPAPGASILSGNSLDNNATWIAVVNRFQATNGWFISDGENVQAGPGADITVRGKLISVRSGDQLLPT